MIENPGNLLALVALGVATSSRERFSDPVDLEVLSVSSFTVLMSQHAPAEGVFNDGIDEWRGIIWGVKTWGTW